MRSRTRKRKQHGGNIAEAKRRIDTWVTRGDIEKDLDLSDLGLRQLPSLPDTIQSFICSSNKLTSLPTLPANLKLLDCSSNKLTSLPVLPNSIEVLLCDANKLTSLPILPNDLKELMCDNNKLKSLPNLPNDLESLSCNVNKLTSLPILPESLLELYCSHNRLPAVMKMNLDDESMEDYITRIRALQEGNATPTNVQEKDVNANARNYISYNNIQNGNMLVNLKRSANKYNSNYKEYIKYNTWKNVLQKTRKNPISRYAMRPNNIKYYTAKKRANTK
jgi:hypothetical protein